MLHPNTDNVFVVAFLWSCLEIFIKFEEWTEKWNVWYSVLSPNIAEAYSRSKPKHEQDVNTLRSIALRSDIYGGIDTAPLETCVSQQPVPAHVTRAGHGRFILYRMPKDNR